MSYTVTTNGTTRNLNDIFDARSSTGKSTTNLTNYTYTISGQVVDLYNYYQPLGTNWNLKFPSNTNYKTLVNGTTTDLANIFQLDFIQSAPSGVTYTPTTSGVLIKMTADGGFTFKYPLSSIEVLGVGGGGGGGQQDKNNAGGGGGGGEVYYFKYSYSSGFTTINALIGSGGTGGISSSNTNASSGSTTTVYLNGTDTKVRFRGGGAGGGGKVMAQMVVVVEAPVHIQVVFLVLDHLLNIILVVTEIMVVLVKTRIMILVQAGVVEVLKVLEQMEVIVQLHHMEEVELLSL
jgi:hypothetical protein